MTNVFEPEQIDEIARYVVTHELPVVLHEKATGRKLQAPRAFEPGSEQDARDLMRCFLENSSGEITVEFLEVLPEKLLTTNF